MDVEKSRVAKHYSYPRSAHTFVSFMLSQNVPPKDVQVIAGHASFSITMDIYGHLMPGAQREAAKKVDKLFEDI
jgi:integrase